MRVWWQECKGNTIWEVCIGGRSSLLFFWLSCLKHNTKYVKWDTLLNCRGVNICVFIMDKGYSLTPQRLVCACKKRISQKKANPIKRYLQGGRMICTWSQQKSTLPDKWKIEHKKENSWKIDFIKFLPGTLSLTKNKSTDQIWTQFSTILVEKLLYTYFWKRMPTVFALNRYHLANANHQKYQHIEQDWTFPVTTIFQTHCFLFPFFSPFTCPHTNEKLDFPQNLQIS